MTEIIIILIILLGVSVWIFNKLIKDRNQVLAAWSDIDVQLKRRHDLIPQLVTTVKTYADYEKATLTAVTELRSRSEAAAHLPEKAGLEDAMESAIQRLIVVAEDYPDLKADQNFRQLQTELSEIEDHLQYARRFYNGSVRIYNTRIAVFPHFIIARVCNFKAAEFFAVNEEEERSTPAVELD